MRGHVTTIVQTAPIIVLLLVAAAGMHLVFKDGLSSWRVGTFGMFSSLDNSSTRRLEAHVVREGVRTKIDLAAYEAEVNRLELWPSDDRLANFLDFLACHELPQDASGITLRYIGLDIDRNVATPIERWRKTAHDCSIQ